MTAGDDRIALANTLWASALMDELVRSGVRLAVIAPGSRSSPLVFAAARHPDVRTIVQIDERSAAFLALGFGKATGRPAAVITTSGTAVANLLPAVVEASQSEAPLLLLTADRPPRLRGADANQAIDQPGIFGGYVRHEVELHATVPDEGVLRSLRTAVTEAMEGAVGDPGGPVHLNLPFEKPLEPVEVAGRDLEGGATNAERSEYSPVPTEPRRAEPSDEVLVEIIRRLREARRPLLIAGRLPRPWETGPALAALARSTGIPLLADPLSGARFVEGGGGLGGYDLALGSDEIRRSLRPDCVLRFGASPTSSRLLAFLEGLEGVPHVVVDGGTRSKDHQGIATKVVHGEPTGVADALAFRWAERPDRDADGASGSEAAMARSDWLQRWSAIERQVADASGRALHEHPCEGTILAEVVRRTAPGELVFVSSSMPVRDLDAFGLPAFRPSSAEGLMVLGNRGASGIDGIVSTAIGAGIGRGTDVTAVVGDLALLHDSNGLLALAESGVRLQLVVINNDGGGIFSLLPVRDHEPEFTRYFGTPHGREPGRVAAVHDLPHRRVDFRRCSPDRLGALVAGLKWAGEGPGSRMIEIRTDREENRVEREKVLAVVATDSGRRSAEPADSPDVTSNLQREEA